MTTARIFALPRRASFRRGRPRVATFNFTTPGRLRTVEVAPDRSLWITTSNDDGRGSGPDKVIRLGGR